MYKTTVYTRVNDDRSMLKVTQLKQQGGAAPDLRGGVSFNSSFPHRSFLNLTVKKNYENWSTCAKFIGKNKSSLSFFLTLGYFSLPSGTELGMFHLPR